MTQKARLWAGLTLLAVLVFNYAAIGFPLVRRQVSIKDETKAILVKQVRSDRLFKNSQEEYMLDLFRREMVSIDRKLLILNCASVTILIFVGSWVIFGLFAHRR